MMISEGVRVYKLLKDLLWIVHISLENPRQTHPFVLFLSNKQTTHPLWNSGHCTMAEYRDLKIKLPYPSVFSQSSASPTVTSSLLSSTTG